MTTYKCTCPEKEHTIDETKEVWQYLYTTILELGEMIRVEYVPNGKAYSVPRIYIAKHGLRGKDLPSLGFQEIP